LKQIFEGKKYRVEEFVGAYLNLILLQC